MRRIVRALAAVAAVALAGPALAEANVVRAAKQYGLGYLQLMIMEDQKLVEKHAKALGLDNVKSEWSTFRSSDVMNDALISGNVDFVSLGVPGLATIWGRTRGNYDVRGVAGLNALPLFLNVRDPSIKSIRDFSDKHRIAVPAVKVSMQALLLQMAAVKEWGENAYTKLDPLTVSLAHPDATAMMLSGRSEVVANFSSFPFQARQLKDPEIRKITDSVEILGGPSSFNVLATTAKFRKENPRLYKAFLAALDEATEIINKDKSAAADMYIRLSADKSPKEEILAIMNDPSVRFTTEVFNLGVFTDFMAKVGSLKNPPKDWAKEMLFEEAKVSK
ncbi:MAG TPA: ABC transporter substrate-binding protein [Beijerinckiaceae bacterium]|nr:ABC transporter substrate-binding protein [Beijerinckiaceae bacterium]